ncbi:MAG TPA: MXAN_5187 C-terminal domain-containing protein [Candidatus Baltobacteraceae bacterium]|nr:MXAN_5187 C-terminal domain-containing protein [Candidatus Baltobacteraceae bacterium]
MATVDEDLNQIERDIRTLKIEYEQYFGGGRKRPPTDTQWRVDSLVRRMNERINEFNFAQRFRLNNLTQTYAKYQEMWRKKTTQKETGVAQHHFGAAAKAIESERAKKAALEAGARAASHAGSIDNPAHHPHRDRPQEPAAFALALSSPEHEKEKIYTLYEKLIEARGEAGEKSSAPSLKDFERFVQQKTKELQDKGGREVEYTVGIEGGRVRLKARVSR